MSPDPPEGGVGAAKVSDPREFLRQRGVTEEEIAAAQAQGALPLLVIDQMLFPGRPRYDEATLVGLVGVEREYARALWRAMGFAALPEDEVAFYDDDLDALGAAVVGDPMRELLPNLVHQTRVTSAAMARIAEQSTDDIERLLHELREQEVPEEEAVRLLLSVFQVERFEKLLWYMFRRQLRASVWRRLAEPGPGAPTTVGFVDLVRFAAVTENVADDELERLILRFEEVAYDAIVDGGGRMVKMIGDAVMFVADDPARATVVAIDLVDAYARDDLLPPARAGLALGRVLARDGDYFGPPVNLAARIVDVARPSRVVVSDELHDALPTGRFSFRRLPPKRLRGMGHPPLWAAARAAD